jgi:hypothetical protein
LHVRGANSNNAVIDNAGEQYTTLSLYNNGTLKAQTYWDQTNSLLVSGTDVSAPYLFKTDSTERMRVSATGNVSIGTASTPVKFLVNSTDAVGIPVGTIAQRPTGATGYIRYNTDYSQFEGYAGSGWGGLGGAQANGVIYENSQTIIANYTMTTNKNGMSAGPITVDTGVTVTIPTGSNWVIV